jgi:phosphodiesterase/alkaline phosphatase D-like protein
VAAEICGTSISARGRPDIVEQVVKDNAHFLYADARRRGYVFLDADAGRLEARLRVADRVDRPDAGVSTAAVFQIKAGTPGIVGPL